MLLVILSHYVSVRTQQTTLSAQTAPWVTLLNLELKSLSFVCVNVFILISGWFGISQKKSSFVHLIIQIVFWWAFGTIVAYLLWPGSFGIAKGFIFLIKIFCQWFVFCYLGLYMVAPVLNAYIQKASTPELKRFVLIYWGFSTFFGYFCYAAFGAPKDFLTGMSILSLVGLYFLGSYMRRASDEGKSMIFNKSAWVYLTGYLILGMLQTLFAFGLLRFGIKSSPYGYMNPVIMMESVCLFMFFAKLRMRHVPWINFLASSAFAAYLLHCSPALGGHFTESFKWIEANFNPSLPVALVYLVLIYVIAVLIDKAWWSIYDLLKRINFNRRITELD